MGRGWVGWGNDYIQNSSSKQDNIGGFSKRQTYYRNYNESIRAIFKIIHSRCVYSAKFAVQIKVHYFQSQHN